VRRYGFRTVWAVGLLTLKYPPTWATWAAEVKRLEVALLPYPFQTQVPDGA
jgi:hypothetical protein